MWFQIFSTIGLIGSYLATFFISMQLLFFTGDVRKLQHEFKALQNHVAALETKISQIPPPAPKEEKKKPEPKEEKKPEPEVQEESNSEPPIDRRQRECWFPFIWC